MKLASVLYKARPLGFSVRIKLTNNGLLVQLAIHYTIEDLHLLPDIKIKQN